MQVYFPCSGCNYKTLGKTVHQYEINKLLMEYYAAIKQISQLFVQQ